MSHKCVIDTHALIWFLEGNKRLGANAEAVLRNPSNELIVPLIALAEAILVVEKGKSNIASVDDLLDDVRKDTRIEVYDLTMAVLQQSITITAIPEIHDRLIVATALHLQSLGHTVSLLTRDTIITASNLVSIIW